MMNNKMGGFSIVELLIVIVVIGILSTISVITYNSVQADARNVKIKNAAHQVAEAIELFGLREGHFPKGGWGSTTVIGTNTECADGANGILATNYYKCSVEDTLVASGYLPRRFTSNLPANKLHGNTPAYTIFVYSTGAHSGMVHYTVENPSEKNTQHWIDEMKECNPAYAGDIKTSSLWANGMRDGVCAKF